MGVRYRLSIRTSSGESSASHSLLRVDCTPLCQVGVLGEARLQVRPFQA